MIQPDKPTKEDQISSPKKHGWIRRHKFLSTFLILVALILGPYIWSRVTSTHRQIQIFGSESDDLVESTPDSVNNRFTVLVMNIAHGRGQAGSNWDELGGPKRERIARIGQLIKDHDPDFVVLNEADFYSTWSGHQNQAEAIAELAGFPYRMEQRNLDFRFLYGSFAFGNALLSKTPIEQTTYIEYPGVERREWEKQVCGKKGGSTATVRIGEQEVQLFAVHTEHRNPAVRAATAKRLLENVPAGPTILAGDFNSTPSGFPAHNKTESGENAIELILESGKFETRPENVPVESEYTFSTYEPKSVIDWVFVSKHFEIIDYEVIQSDLSDHFPLKVRLELKPPE